MLHGTELPGVVKLQWRDCPGGIEFTHPDFAMTLRMTDSDIGPSRFYTSYDRGKTWDGPFRLPEMGTPGVAARTDMLVAGKHEALCFLTAGKRDKREGRPFCARTTDGGKTWEFLSWIGPEPKGYAIMPASARLADNGLLVVVRCREGAQSWLAAYRSEDGGRHWQFLNRPVEDTGEGNPASLIRLRDGRLCLTYGVRAAPYRMCAKLSRDDGQTWSREIVLREDGSSRDIGYPRSVQRPDGKVVTVYYFSDAKTGPERYVAATIWDPNAPGL
ncbi:MAG TPA: sialidase family protein [Chthonomonadaceae bacterium]|nr:sialidase family protein [Chthonomonadaceae bacterium]